MSGTPNQQLKPLFLLKVLYDKTDEQHKLSQSEIVHILEKEYDITCERKSFYRQISALRDIYGADIEYSPDQPRGYYIASRKFENTELALLIDAVKWSKFISPKKSKALVEKISSFAGENMAKHLSGNFNYLNIGKTDNERIYYTMNEILNAINSKKRIEFLYFDYDVNKKKHYRNNKEKYLVSPYALVWDDEKYYLHAYHEKYNTISSFRVDMMEQAQITPLPRLKEEQYANYSASERMAFNQYSGENMIVELKVDNSLISVILDRFNNKVSTRKADDNSFIARVNVEMSPNFLGWVFSFKEKVSIVFPEKAKNLMKDHIKQVLENYGD